MDERKVILHRRDGQGATSKYYKKRDGSFAVAIEIAPDVIEFGRLIAVPDRTVLDAYEDALGRARAALRAGVEAGDTLIALAVFEAAVDAALALLREGLRGARRHERARPRQDRRDPRRADLNAIEEMTSEHPREAIACLGARPSLRYELNGADGAIIERAIKRLELIIVELNKTEDLLNNAPFSFGKLTDDEAAS